MDITSFFIPAFLQILAKIFWTLSIYSGKFLTDLLGIVKYFLSAGVPLFLGKVDRRGLLILHSTTENGKVPAILLNCAKILDATYAEKNLTQRVFFSIFSTRTDSYPVINILQADGRVSKGGGCQSKIPDRNGWF